MHGFPGYDIDDVRPTLVQVLNGEKPANTAAIRVDIVPGTQADSLVVLDRRTIFTHPVTAARTELLTVAQRDRPKPLTLSGALKLLDDPKSRLLVNAKSGRAAVEIPALSVMTDEGEVEARVRLMRPMERPTCPAKDMGETHWRVANEETFAKAWEREVAQLPEYVKTTLHVVSGLLLPIWKRLPRNRAVSIASRPTPASASSRERFRPPGSPPSSTRPQQSCPSIKRSWA